MNTQPNDYAGLPRIFGAGYLEILNKYVFSVHFNHVTMSMNNNNSNQGNGGNIKIKYAVVDLQTLLSDLKQWHMLTLAGRLHKPVYLNILNTNLPS